MVNGEIKYPAAWAVTLVKAVFFAVGKVLWFLRYRQTENIPNDLAGGMLIVSNHQTYFDPFWICVPVRRKFRFMAYDKAFDWFLIGRLIRYLGSFPVSLTGSGTRKAWRESKKSLADGATLVVFPEASRGFSNGELMPFKSGAARLAYDAKVPILPVTIRGANRVWAQDFKFPRLFRRVEIVYHPLYEIPPLPADIELTEFLENQTAELAEIIRAGQ